jgi:hypothetical protein
MITSRVDCCEPQTLVVSNGFQKGKIEGRRFVFSATVSAEMQAAVEELFFFNPRQSFRRSAISVTIERTGVPRIVEFDGRLWIDVPPHAMQCLFACDSALKPGEPVGVALYERPSADVLSVAHLAVDPQYAYGGYREGMGLGLLLIERVKEIARRINGITRVQVPYRNQCFLRI